MRLLPVLIISLIATLGLKINHIMVEGKPALQAALIGDTVAEDTPSQTSSAVSLAQKEAGKKTTETTPEDIEPETEQKPEAPQPPMPGTITLPDMKAPNCNFSDIEVDLLQSLAKRRQSIDEQAKSLDLRENVLRATEMNIDKKIDELREIKQQVENLLKLYDEKEQDKIRSLVKIYQNMKPKDAARIFEELDMDVLLQVVDKMDERRISPILASMNPTKAKELTMQLAEQKKLPRINDENLTE